MYNRLHKYLTTEKLLYSKQFGFQIGFSTEHVTFKLELFEKYHNRLGVFIEFLKAFDTVDHIILIKNLEIYGRINNIFCYLAR